MKLYKFQEEGLNLMWKYRYVVNGDEMGLGKTPQAIELINKSFREEGAKTFLIVCPSYLKANWGEELKVWLENKLTYKVCFSKNDLVGASDYNVVVVNYEQLKHCAGLFGSSHAVIVDEAHYLKNLTAQRTKLFHKYVNLYRPRRLALLSGTAITNGVKDFYSLLSLISLRPEGAEGYDVRKLYRNTDSFCDDFCYCSSFKVNHRIIKKYSGLKNKQKLKKLLIGKYFRRTADKVLDLPKLQEIEFRSSFREFGLKEDYAKGDAHLSTAKKESAIHKAPATAGLALSMLREGKGPLVIFSDHVDPVGSMALELSKEFKVKTITGSTPAIEKGNIQKDFQSGKVDVLIATIGSASTGLTLTKGNILIFNDISWIPANNYQAKKRIHRISQERNSKIYYILNGDVDAMILKNVKAKEEVLKEAL